MTDDKELKAPVADAPEEPPYDTVTIAIPKGMPVEYQVQQVVRTTVETLAKEDRKALPRVRAWVDKLFEELA
jgi:hypothetical protein